MDGCQGYAVGVVQLHLQCRYHPTDRANLRVRSFTRDRWCDWLLDLCRESWIAGWCCPSPLPRWGSTTGQRRAAQPLDEGVIAPLGVDGGGWGEVVALLLVLLSVLGGRARAGTEIGFELELAVMVEDW